MVAEEQEYLESNQTDPLLDLKKRDLDIQEAEINRRALNDQERLDLEKQKDICRAPAGALQISNREFS